MIEVQEYLASYGAAGDFGRFRPVKPLRLRRGDRCVLRTARGVETGEILCPATARHAHFLPNTSVGALLRPLDETDETILVTRAATAEELLRAGRALIGELNLPLELLDAEVLLDGDHAVLHHVRRGTPDVRPLVSQLSRRFEMHIGLVDLTRQEHEEHEDHGCGSCGSEGGCGSCGSGGGCGSCGSTKTAPDQAHFAALRDQMEHHHRVPLL